MWNKLSYDKATIAEALLHHGHKLTPQQAAIIREHYIHLRSLTLIGAARGLSQDIVAAKRNKALTLLGLPKRRSAPPPLELSEAYERLRWALRTERKTCVVEKSDLHMLLQVLGEV